MFLCQGYSLPFKKIKVLKISRVYLCSVLFVSHVVLMEFCPVAEEKGGGREGGCGRFARWWGEGESQ